MKKTISTGGFLMMMLLVCHAYGQEFIPGLKLGFNSTSFHSEQMESSPGLGLEAGFFFAVRMSDQLDLLSEFNYSQKKAVAQGRSYTDFSSSLLSAPEDYNVQFNSLSWGVIANYYLKAPYISLQAGPVLSYNKVPDDPAKDHVFFGDNEVIHSGILDDGFREGIDYALAFGLSGGSEALRLNVRYHLGLKDYLKNTDYNQEGYSVKANYLQLSLYYHFLNYRAFR